MNFVPLEGETAVVIWGLTSRNVEVNTEVWDKHAAAVSRVEGTVSNLSPTWLMRGRIRLRRKVVGNMEEVHNYPGK